MVKGDINQRPVTSIITVRWAKELPLPPSLRSNGAAGQANGAPRKPATSIPEGLQRINNKKVLITAIDLPGNQQQSVFTYTCHMPIHHRGKHQQYIRFYGAYYVGATFQSDWEWKRGEETSAEGTA